MSARATRRPRVRGKSSGGRGMRGGKASDSEFPGCVLALLFFASVAFLVAGGIVLAAVTA